MDEITTMHFEFKDWQKCFQVWQDNLPIYGDEMMLIISRNPYTSGYWIQPKDQEIADDEYVYWGDQVLELKKRIILEHQRAHYANRSPKFVH